MNRFGRTRPSRQSILKRGQDAQAFVASEELKKAMQGAGVIGAPTIWIQQNLNDLDGC